MLALGRVGLIQVLGPTHSISLSQIRVEANMRLVLRICGVVLMLLGAIWILQGINVLPGSFMTGQIQWAIYGAVAVAAGLLLLFVATRVSKKRVA